MLEELGEAFLRAGRWQEARQAFAAVLKERPNSGHALWGIARTYALSDAGAEAEAAYRTFLKSWRYADEDLPQVIEARQWLTERDK